MGVHSPIDILVGLLVGVAGVAAHLWWGAALDAFVTESALSPLVLTAVVGLLISVRPADLLCWFGS